MDISVAHYLSYPELDSRISRCLKSAGITVTRVNTLSAIHELLHTRAFDAVIVSSRFLEKHGVVPAQHLWEHRSPVTFITVAPGRDGTVDTGIHTIPDSISERIMPEGHATRLAYIETVLRTGKPPAFPPGDGSRFADPALGETKSPAGVYGAPRSHPEERRSGGDRRKSERGETPLPVPPVTPVTPVTPVAPASGGSADAETGVQPLPGVDATKLPRKLATLLSLLSRAGRTGAGVARIESALWGVTLRSRKADIQIYVSKLRKVLDSVPGEPYRILREGDRYILVIREPPPDA